MSSARIKMLGWSIAKFHFDRLAPVPEVLACGSRNPAKTFATHVLEGSEIAKVLLFGGGPEPHVLRIERPFGEHRLCLHRLPMDAVGRLKRMQTGSAEAAKGLVSFGGGRVRPVVQKRAEVMREG